MKTPLPNQEILTVEQLEPSTQAEVVIETSEKPVKGSEGYIVSEELYEQTSEEIKTLIKELNLIISKKRYNHWLTYLSAGYIRKYNSTEELSIINDYPQLKDNNISLNDLKDYFDWVVVPSRSRAVLGDIRFISETKVIAYSSFAGEKVKLYQLEKNDGKWKITAWD